MNKIYYFDNNATTQLSPASSRAIAYTNYYNYGNASSLYSLGLESKQIIDSSRSSIKASLFRNMSGNIIFTSGATEGNNAVLNSALRQHPMRRTIITTSIEHPSIMRPVQMYEESGYNVVYLPVSELGLDPDAILPFLSSDVVLVSIMCVNNETGMILPVEEVFSKVKAFDKSIICHSDCVQAVGKTELPLNADFITVSAHKFHGPKGVGCIFKKNDTVFSPFILGGGQEKGYRSGTENISGIKGMEVAAKELNGSYVLWENIDKLQFQLESFLKRELGAYIVGSKCKRVSGVTNVGFNNIDGNQLELKLNMKRIMVSTGSACSSNKAGISPIIKSLNVPRQYASTIRVSMSKYTTQDEVNYLIEHLRTSVIELYNT